MRRIFAFSFSLLLIIITQSASGQEDADTVKADHSLAFGYDVTGAVNYLTDNSKINIEGQIAYRINYKYFLVIEPGFGAFSYEQYNYSYNSSGIFFRMGTDINMLAPVRSKINHFAGIGLRYGVSLFSQESPFIRTDNYWGVYDTSIEKDIFHAHFIELQGGVKAEIFRNFLIGWTVKLRLMVYSSGKNGNKPVYVPGLGGTDRLIAPAVGYYIIYRIPLKKSSSG